MLIAVFADIHANREAFDACLDDARTSGAERQAFLGDIVGYGADPAYVADAVAQCVREGAIAVKGNHDAAVDGGTAGMTATAEAAIAWTRDQLSPRQRRFLADLPLEEVSGDCLFVHGDASAPAAWNYVRSAAEAVQSLRATKARVVFCGHVHKPQIFGADRGSTCTPYAVEAEVEMILNPPRRWHVVLGSVGQPRDRNPAACYALFDTDSKVLTIRRVDYDIETAAAKIQKARLPPGLAYRLFVGL